MPAGDHSRGRVPPPNMSRLNHTILRPPCMDTPKSGAIPGESGDQCAISTGTVISVSRLRVTPPKARSRSGEWP